MGDDSQRAAGRMKLGIRRLLDLHPLLGGLLATWAVRESQVPTMAVCWDNHRISLIYSPGFVLGLQMEELLSVLMHEVRHVIYGHCTMSAEDWPNRNALVVAQEVTVNEGLTNLPGSPIILADYPMLEPRTDTHERYAILARFLDPASAPQQDHERMPNPTARQPGSASPADGQNAQETAHHPWDDFAENRSEVEADLRANIDEVMSSGRALGKDAKELRRAVNHLKPGLPGWCPGGTSAAIGAVTREIQVAGLRHLLLGLTGTARRRSRRYDWPSRRMPHLVGIVPGRRYAQRRVRVNAVIDTSGSMDGATLASIASILRFIDHAAELTVVECDAAIHRVYPFTGAIRTVVGRGGTDFRPPLERAFLARTRAEAVVYFTDGIGPAPATSPHVPVIWGLTHGGTPPTDWGKVLRVEV